MEVTGSGKSPNATLSFRYNANNEELEELFQPCEDDPPTPQSEPPAKEPVTASPKRADKTSIIDKYFKNIRTEKPIDKQDDAKLLENKRQEDTRSPVPSKEASSSPVKDYLKGLGKKSTSEVIPEVKESGNETWKIFHDFKFKIAQAVEDMKTRSVDEPKEKLLPPESSTSDSEENSAIKDMDQQSVGDTDNQVSSLDSSIQNLSEMTQPLTAKASQGEPSLSANKIQSSSSEDTHKNIENNDLADVPRDDSIEIESGVEALEDTIDAFGDVTQLESAETPVKKPLELAATESPIPTTDFNFPPSKNDLHNTKPSDKPKSTPFTFTMYFLTIFLIVNYFLFPKSDIWIGFLLGIWVFCFTSYCKHWFLDNYFSEWEPGKSSYFQMKSSSAAPITYTIPSVKEHRPMKKYEGWINHYRFPDYDPYTYHINKTTTAFIKLEGCNLRISYTRTKVAKKALWDEKIDNVTFYQHRLYNLTGARIILLPKGLVSRRQWSKKYPICIILNEEEKIQVLEKENPITEKKIAETEKKTKEQQPLHETESAETNTSPEKKKKFVWRRREKSISQSEVEPEKEGLRHRLVRKMHRDKRSDSISTSADPDAQVQTDKTSQSDDSPTTEHEIELVSKSACSTKEEVIEEELDESELSRIKEFLDEAELDGSAEGAAEGEWSLQVKQSKDKHSHLFLFARTGRDKHEWFRRLNSAISEANASNDSSTAEDKPTSEQSQETKDGVELAVYKSSEKDTVTVTKNKTKDSVSESAGIPTMYPLLGHANSYEKSFWAYLFKIMQGAGGAGGAGAEEAECECRLLPGEVAWVNTVLARLMFDVMRDPAIIARLQARIQRKLNTLKLPSFMSPLVVTELSLAGACPLVRRVAAPACDERGVWLDADLRYDGGAYIAISTQINLMKLKEKNVTLEDQLMPANENVEETEVNAPSSPGPGADKQFQKRKPAIYDSDVEDSAESSSDDESPPVQVDDGGENLPPSDLPANTADGGGSSKKKFLRMVDKIATNKYFQQVTDYKYVKRAMEGLSNTDIKLQLEVNGLEGRLALNLPSPPHDRLWIGFRTNPQLALRARPAVGARAVRFAHITNWIEQKLTKEFEKVLVLPNMEDIAIDLMTPTPVQFE
ncbi:unnamed protein product [Parnassius mnemosyne]|uniref:SMP-LTD domain-containing protein n=1 Tax=Parnassius mnemosyne TaxID=213953 RepID=A0AAV1LQU7_9NEOP